VAEKTRRFNEVAAISFYSKRNPWHSNAWSHLSVRELTLSVTSEASLKLWPNLCKVASGLVPQCCFIS